MKTYKNKHFTGERSLFRTHGAQISDCLFDEGESPLKESSDLELERVTFGWKYPLWYTNNIVVRNSTFLEMSRSGLWYVNNALFEDCHIVAPKEFRRCKNVTLNRVFFDDGMETLWECEDVKLNDVTLRGDYFLMNSKNVEIHNLNFHGSYFCDGLENLKIYDSNITSKDSFWNCKNVYVKNTIINGEFIGWNTENITFEDCVITSHQGFCYIKNLTMKNCKVLESDLTFEYCENVDLDLDSELLSVKNPISGTIKCLGVKELIQDDERIDKSKIHILVKDGDTYREL